MTDKVSKIQIGLQKSKVIVTTVNSSNYFEKSGKKRWRSIVKCNCGESFEINNNYFLRENNISCKNCKYNDDCMISIGEIFDKLTVIGYENTTDKRGRKRCICNCICGNTITIRPESLKSNKKNNCGCIVRNGTYVGKLSKDVFHKMKNNAISRNLEFEIDMKYLWELYEKQNGKCALSGVTIEFGKKTIDNRTASIDRIDSSKGYTVGNLQWVHKDINTIKWDLPCDKFIELCKLISDYNK